MLVGTIGGSVLSNWTEMDPATNYTVNPGWALLMSDSGISVVNVLRRAKLPRDIFSRGHMALTAFQYFALWQAIEDEVGDPNFPLLIGRSISLEAFDPPIFAAACSRDLNVAARRIAQFKKLVGPMLLSVTQSESETVVEPIWPHDARPPRVLSTVELVFWVALVRLTTRYPVRPVRFTTPELPDDADAFLDYLGSEGADGSALHGRLLRHRRRPPIPNRQRANVGVLRTRAAQAPLRG